MMSGSYFEALQQRFPKLKPQDVWSLICCGSDLHHPYDGWAGIVAYPVYSDARPFTLFFGDFTEQLMQWENVPEFRIERGTSKLQAFSEFRTYIGTETENPVFISANAATWALRVLQGAMHMDAQGTWNAQLICLRDLYSKTVNRLEFNKQLDFVGQAFQQAPSLPKTFGLHKIGAVLDISVPELSDKATQRAQLTAECAYKLLEKPYPAEDED
jgi:hypothetical protein